MLKIIKNKNKYGLNIFNEEEFSIIEENSQTCIKKNIKNSKNKIEFNILNSFYKIILLIIIICLLVIFILLFPKKK